MTETTKPTIKRGDSGPAVVELQRLLLGLVADGIFGAKTEAAVRRFQERRSQTSGASKNTRTGEMPSSRSLQAGVTTCESITVFS
jgi:peptidoglycan hydrolase-like protein with peptidoglycan-binding domain